MSLVTSWSCVNCGRYIRLETALKQSRVCEAKLNRRVFSLLQNWSSVSVSVVSRSESGRLFQSYGEHAAKYLVLVTRTCRWPRAAERIISSSVHVAATGTSCNNWHTELLEVLRSGLMRTLVDKFTVPAHCSEGPLSRRSAIRVSVRVRVRVRGYG